MKLNHLTLETLFIETKKAVKNEKAATTIVLYHLLEIDTRQGYLVKNYKNLFDYCRKELGFSESESWARISAMRVLVKAPEIKKPLEQGALTLTQVGLIGGVLKKGGEMTPQLSELIKEVSGKSTRETQEILNKNEPVNKPQTVNIKLPKDVYDQFSLLKEKLGIIKDEDLLSTLIKMKEKEMEEKKTREEQKFKKEESQEIEVKNPEGRYIPVKLKRRLLHKSQHRCEYISPMTGERCQAKTHLHVHHHTPYAVGGRTEEDNLSIRCSHHNSLHSYEWFGCKKFSSDKKEAGCHRFERSSDSLSS